MNIIKTGTCRCLSDDLAQDGFARGLVYIFQGYTESMHDLKMSYAVRPNAETPGHYVRFSPRNFSGSFEIVTSNP